MRSLFRNRILLFVVSLHLALAVAVYLTLKTSDNRLIRAEELIVEWKLAEAESILAVLVDDFPHSSKVLDVFADVLLLRGESRRAVPVCQKLTQLEPQRQHHHRARQAFAFFYLNLLDLASSVAQSALVTALDRQDTLIAARCHNVLGLIAFNEARYDAAKVHQTESLRLARAVQAVKEEADALRQLGVLAWYSGNHQQARRMFYEPALALYRRINDRLGEATTLSNIGHLHFESNELIQNLRLQLEAFEIRTRIGDRRGLADSYYFLGLASNVTKGASLSFSFFKKSLDQSAAIAYDWGKEVAARALVGVISNNPGVVNDLDVLHGSTAALSGEGRIYVARSRAMQLARRELLREAIAEYRSLIAFCDSVGYHSTLPVVLTECAQLLLRVDSTRAAERLVQRARTLTTTRRYPQHYGRVELAFAGVLAASGRTDEAREVLTSLTAHLDSLYLKDISIPSPQGLGFEVAAAAVHAERSKTFRMLIDITPHHQEDILFQMIEKERLLPFWSDQRPIGESIFNEPLRTALAGLDAHSGHESFDAVHKILAAAGEEHLQRMSTLNPTPRPAREGSQLAISPLRQVQEVLDEKDVLLEYFVGERKVIVVVVTRATQDVYELAVTPADLASMTDLFREMVLRGKHAPHDGSWREPARSLYRILISPFIEQGMVQPGRRLLISPHGILYAVPFHALLVSLHGEADRFLVEQFITSYLPSATSFVHGKPAESPRGSSLLIVVPDVSDLPYAEREIHAISKHAFSSITQQKGAAAKPRNVLSSLADHDIIHVAAHARMNLWHPLSSRIELSRGSLELRDIITRNIPARLVVLSACETGVSTGAMDDIPAGHDLVSFPRAFLSAGVSSVVGSLWLVEDEATADLMKAFYAHLMEEQSGWLPASALCRAQREFIASPDRRSDMKNHPFYWAAFCLTGTGK